MFVCKSKLFPSSLITRDPKSFPEVLALLNVIIISLNISSAEAAFAVKVSPARIIIKAEELFVSVILWDSLSFPPSKVSFPSFPIRTSDPKPPLNVFEEESPVKVSLPKPPSIFSIPLTTNSPTPLICSFVFDKSKFRSLLVNPKLNRSCPIPPSIVSFPANEIIVSFPAPPTILLASLVPIKISWLLPPITPSIESKVSFPCS